MYQTATAISTLLLAISAVAFVLELFRSIFKKWRTVSLRRAKIAAGIFALSVVSTFVCSQLIYKDYGLPSSEGLKEAQARANAAANIAAADKSQKDAAVVEKAKIEADAVKAQEAVNEKAAALAKKCDDKIAAFVMSQEFVKRNLKAPSTASFPWFTGNQVAVTTKPGCAFTVLAWVDSQNSFGAQLRSRYVVNLKYVDVGNSWQLTDIAIK